MGFYQREPWGFHVDDLMNGMLNATVAAAAGAKDLSPETFMLSSAMARAKEASEVVADVPQGVSDMAKDLQRLIPPGRDFGDVKAPESTADEKVER